MATQTAQNPLREKMLKGLAYQKAGEIEKAQRCYKLVLKKLPEQPDALNLLGVTYRQQGFPKRAMEYIQKAIKVNPNQSVFYANLARTMIDLKVDGEGLLAVTEKALSLNPREREALNIKAIALSGLQRMEEAEDLFKALIVAYPNFGDAYTNYGLLLRKSYRWQEALDTFKKAQIIEPNNPENCIEQARCRLELKLFDESLEAVDAALEKFPRNPYLEHEKARLLFSISRTFEGLVYAERAAAAAPHVHHHLVTLGVHYLMLGRGEDTIATLNKAKEIAPQGALSGLDWNLSLAHLHIGDLKTGWELHPARYEDSQTASVRKQFPMPAWEGEDLLDKTVLVWGDQGLGDALKSATMLPDLMDRGAKLILEVSAKSVPLFERSFPEVLVRPATPKDEQDPADADYDLTANITDIAKYLRPDIESFRRAKYPVYTFDKDRARSLLDRLPDAGSKPVIGIAWRSKNLAKYRARYYLSAPDFSPILDAEDAIYVNLQYQPIQRELDYMVKRSNGKFTYFQDVDLFNDLVAASDLTAICDVVVSANTSVADMAAS
eukprot:g1399.t1